MLTDRSAKPATISPVMEPPLKAKASAGPKPFLAASVVRTFVLTETLIPTIPEAAENRAPIKKEMGARGLL